jgi:3'(2'), 5'-bisphosphate nucleotidase
MQIDHGALLDIVARAGDAIVEVYGTDFDVENKSDQSPLTQADLAAHEIIAEALARLTPEIPLISEESEPPGFATRSGWDRYWLVDPLDGTKEFVNRNGEFTVNIALIEAHEPIFGIVGVPVQGRIFLGDLEAGIAQLHADGASSPIATDARSQGDESLNVVASRSHGGERLETYLDALSRTFPDLTRTPVGSSLKLCTLAEGKADFYPRLGPTSEWDIGAAHAVLRAAGGEVYTFDGKPLAYNTKESFLNPDFFAVADRRFPWAATLPPVPEADSD